MNDHNQFSGYNPYAQAAPGRQPGSPGQAEIHHDRAQVPPEFAAGHPEMPPWGLHPHHLPYSGLPPYGINPHHPHYPGPQQPYAHPAYQGHHQMPPEAFAANMQGQQIPPAAKKEEGGMNAMLQGLSESMGLSSIAELLSMDDKEFWKGAALGAVIALLATNENVRENIMATLAKLMATMKVKPESRNSEPERQGSNQADATGSEPAE